MPRLQTLSPRLKYAQLAAFFLLFVALIYVRRSRQLLSPQVWDEDGTLFLFEYINQGAGFLLHPVYGYFILVSKLISMLSLTISYFYYPEVSTILCWLFIAGVCLAITYAPTWLRGRAVLAALALLVPSNAEVIGIPLYSFWWASLLLFLVVLWENDSRDVFFRGLFLIVGGLSSPAILLVLPFLVLRVILFNHRIRNTLLLILGGGCAAAQYYALCQVPALVRRTLTLEDLGQISPRVFGNYLVGNFSDRPVALGIAGGALVLLVIVALFSFRGTLRRPVLPFLFLLCIGSILMCIQRTALANMDPRQYGPRYFFFPFVLISWLLVNIVALPGAENWLARRGGSAEDGSARGGFRIRWRRRRWGAGLLRISLGFSAGQAGGRVFWQYFRWAIAATAALLLVVGLLNVLPVLSRDHVNFHWREHVASSIHFDRYMIPIQYDGSSECWYLTIQRPQARKLLDSDIAARIRHLSTIKTYPYTIRADLTHQAGDRFADLSAVATTPIPAAIFPPNNIPGFQVLGSLHSSEADQLAIAVHLRRGDKVLYCSGTRAQRQAVRISGAAVPLASNLPPSVNWVILDFSNDLLPDEFTATFVDEGTTRGEWFAIALQTPAPAPASVPAPASAPAR